MSSDVAPGHGACWMFGALVLRRRLRQDRNARQRLNTASVLLVATGGGRGEMGRRGTVVVRRLGPSLVGVVHEDGRGSKINLGARSCRRRRNIEGGGGGNDAAQGEGNWAAGIVGVVDDVNY